MEDIIQECQKLNIAYGHKKAILARLPIRQKLELVHNFSGMGALIENVPSLVQRVTISSDTDSHTLEIQEPGGNCHTWTFTNEKITRQFNERSPDMFFEFTRRTKYWNELINKFLRSSIIRGGISFINASENLVLEEQFKTPVLTIEMSTNANTALFHHIMEKLDPEGLSVATIDVPSSLHHLLKSAKFSNTHLDVNIPITSPHLEEFHAKSIGVNRLGLRDHGRDLSYIAEGFVAYQNEGFFLETELENAYNHRMILEEMVELDGWEMKMLSDRYCASFTKGKKEVNIYLKSLDSSFRVKLIMKIMEAGTARQSQNGVFKTFSEEIDEIARKPYKERMEINSLKPWMRDIPYVFNRIEMNYEVKQMRVDDVLVETNDAVFQFSEIFNNYNSNVHILKIIGCPSSFMLKSLVINADKLILESSDVYSREFLFYLQHVKDVTASSNRILRNKDQFFKNIEIKILGPDLLSASEDSEEESEAQDMAVEEDIESEDEDENHEEENEAQENDFDSDEERGDSDISDREEENRGPTDDEMIESDDDYSGDSEDNFDDENEDDVDEEPIPVRRRRLQ